MIVVDANLIACFLLRNEFTPLAIQVFEQDPDWYAPLLWQSEVRNVLTTYIRKDFLKLERAGQIMDEAHKLMLNHERMVSSDSVLELAGHSRCSAYDCEYVALAKDMNMLLVTFDKEVLRDFSRIAISPQRFVQS